jgi:hypothetical protein
MEVLKNILDKAHVTHFAAFLLQLFYPAQRTRCSISRFFPAHPLGNVFVNLILKVKLDLIIELLLSLAVPK